MPPPLSQYMRDDLKIGIFTPTESSQKRLLTCIINVCSHTSANALILPEHVQAVKQEHRTVPDRDDTFGLIMKGTSLAFI